MDSYVGLDASLKKTSVCVVDGTGKVLCEGVVDSQPSAIAKFLKSRALDAVRIGIETGPTSIWLTTELRTHGLPVICIDARHARAVLKMQINKSDRNDAAGIARIMQTGWFKEVRLKGFDSHAVRALLTSRATLVKMKRDLEAPPEGMRSRNAYSNLPSNLPNWRCLSYRCSPLVRLSASSSMISIERF